jgi:hypothetical protein
LKTSRKNELKNGRIEGFRDSGIEELKDWIDRIHLIPQFLNSQFLN